jgi:Transposase DDE domain
MDPVSFDESWKIIRGLLPNELEKEARASGFLRRLRGFESVEVLTRILLMHASGLSLEQTALRARELGLGKTTPVALHHRLRSSGEYFKRLCRHVQEGLRQRLNSDHWPQGWKYRVIDATDVSEPGATGSMWKVHYSLRLPELACDHFELTDYHQGETLQRWNIAKDEVVLADRAYSHREALGPLMASGAHFVVRLNTGVFPLETKEGQSVDLLKVLGALKIGRPKAWRFWFRHGKSRSAIELCAVKKSPEAAAKSQRLARRRAQQDGCELQKETLLLADYVLILTNLHGRPWSPPILLDLYRCRWQVELAFKRLKSLLQFGHLPKKDPQTARAWMQMKLLIALLVERLLYEAKFVFPWGYDWRKIESLESVSGNV